MWAQAWQTGSSPWCERHASWLVDRCSACARELRLTTVSFLACRCSHPLSANESAVVRPDLLDLVSTDSVSLKTICLLGAFSLHGFTGKPGKKAARVEMSHTRVLLEEGTTVAVNWPHAFRDALVRHRAGGVDGEAQLLAEAFPRLREVVEMLQQVAWRQRVEDEMNTFCQESFSTARPVLRRPGTALQPPTLKTLSRQLGRRFELLASTIDARLPSLNAVRTTSGGRRRRLLNAADIECLSQTLIGAVSMAEAARMLALPRSRVAAMVNAQLLTMRGMRLLRDQVSSLVPAKAGSAAPLSISPSLPLRVALRNWVRLEETADFVRDVVAGAIFVQSDVPRPLGDLLVPLAAISKWSQDRRNRAASLLSLGQVAVGLGVKPEVVSDLIKIGVLRARKGTLQGRRCWCVTSQEMASFHQLAVPLASLAKVNGVRVRDGYAWATERGLKVLTGPRVDGTRQYFVKRPTD